ncbi:RNA polymerase-associated protein RapA [Methylococcus sp. EFPC2]|uniref:RNA polymerase-associated protein RapA n=1 Tax=Methylococcus sp. EFPC2 TaxID=2812648 RepID=UPI0019672413|nr:RNA polymerase-associated protein RapA [Methylococcus sp. EFPC2]QSA95913.1 RNA polymerase-associated protein RapA [Methylococcus sp. EFPC2]
MTNFAPGQRWISETEPELGLGTLIEAAHNRLTVLFIASSERRTYAADNAPLTRVRFTPGDRVESVDGWAMEVESVEEKEGLLCYLGLDEDGGVRRLEEMDLNHFLQFNKPQDRLFTGQIDSSALFGLRVRTLKKLGELAQSPVRGLIGPRTSLIPHQLYIAHEVAGRQAPRVLLADEVGLGKTIEAGLIIHHQLLTGRAERVLILTPEPLVHQWLLEMRRRFNLNFSLFNDERYWQGEDQNNPFQDEQLVLCGLDFFRDEPERQARVLEAGWDLCVVDEAHHLEWSEEAPSADYRLVESLAHDVAGLLLLTATPEQLGKHSHFARLRLLDPDRFYDYQRFLAEEAEYESYANLLEPLLGEAPLDDATIEGLAGVLALDRAEDLLAQANDGVNGPAVRQQLIRLILDRHGTGRILFRNTRATVQGFPERSVRAHPLPLPEVYRVSADAPLEQLLCPELSYPRDQETPWWRFDPRVTWLTDTLRGLRPAKVLVICARAQTAIDLEDALRVLGGINAAVFHEGLSIVARDRAAAWFADEDEGAQALVCSEIGSEGRNFQFAHHLVLFDLPLNPDLLEQRIGRLDRIGQSATIQIHVPYLAGAQSILFDWYRHGLDAFGQPCPAGQAVYLRLGDKLRTLLRQPDAALQAELIDQARRLNANLLADLHNGRDRLLELNSCRKDEADELAGLIRVAEGEDELWPYLEDVFDAYGVTSEEHSSHCHILLPGDHMRVSHFPELPEDGVTVTLDRGIGLAREDMLFLTWEHPLVRGAMDLILNSEHGNAAFAMVRHEALRPGQLFLEAVYQMECPAPRRLNAARYLPQTLLRLLINQDHEDFSHLPAEHLVDLPRPADRTEVTPLLRRQRKLIERMLAYTGKVAEKRLPGMVSVATKEMLDTATAELKRLSALRKVNPSVRQEELDVLKQNAVELHGHLQAARLRLDALRVIVTA